MFMVLKRKKIVFASVCLLLILSIYIGFGINLDNTQKNVAVSTENSTIDNHDVLLPGEAIEVSATNDYFSKAKNDRDEVRSKASELLRNILDSEKTSDETKREAEASIITMADNMDKEVKIENLLYAKGFQSSVAFISDNLVTLTIKTDKLKNEDMAKINDIVYEITGNNNIKIVEVD